MAQQQVSDERIEEACAQVAHEAARAYQEALGKDDLPSWDAVTLDGRKAMEKVVKYVIAGTTAEGIHLMRCQKLDLEGWTYGRDFHPGKKTTPMMVEWEKLPSTQAVREHIIVSQINAMALALGHSKRPAATVKMQLDPERG